MFPWCLGMLCYNTSMKAIDDDSEDFVTIRVEI